MEYITNRLSKISTILIGIVIMALIIKIIPMLIFVGIVVYFLYKITKYFKNKKCNNKKYKSKVNTYTFKDNDDDLDISENKIIDVDFEEIK